MITTAQQTQFDKLITRYGADLVTALVNRMGTEELFDGIPYELEQLAGE